MHKLSAFALAVLLGKGALSQVASADTATYQQAVQAAVASYHQTITNQAELYNGVEHVRYLPTIEGIPYYQADEWKPGTIEYNGVVYRDVPMKYDMVKDQVIVKHTNGFSAFSLYSPRVTYFDMGGDRFVYIPAGSDKTLPPAGFYQQVRSGPLTVLVKRTKWIDEQVQSGKLELKFLSANRYYVRKDGAYHNLRREADLMELLGERRKEAKQTLQRAGIRYKKNPELAILTIADYYNK